MRSKATYLRSVSFAAISTLPVILGCALLGAPQARADYVVTLDEVGNNVEATANGAIDTTGLTAGTLALLRSSITPNIGMVATGGNAAAASTVQFFDGASGPTNFGSGGTAIATSASGTLAGLNATLGSPLGRIYLPQGYVSGTDITSSAVFANATFASLGITPGMKTWSWGSGPDQSFTIDAVPLPATLPLFGSGLGALGLIGWRRKRRALAVA